MRSQEPIQAIKLAHDRSRGGEPYPCEDILWLVKARVSEVDLIAFPFEAVRDGFRSQFGVCVHRTGECVDADSGGARFAI